MFSIRLRPRTLLALIYFLFLSTNIVNALPLYVRQNNATSIQIVHTSQTLAGQLTETCDITLTPITDKNGQPAVQEVKRCSLALDAGNTIASTTTSSNSQGSFSTITTETSVASSVPGTSLPSSSSPSKASGVVSSPSSSIVTSPATSIASVSGIIVNGSSTITGSPTHTETTSAVTSSTNISGVAADDTNAAASGTSAAAAESSSSTSISLPGKTMSVLPIGLGVFAGISVIALIVVGLVTYERTKYRKAFRQRKLAESGATMGYGGMAQRP